MGQSKVRKQLMGDWYGKEPNTKDLSPQRLWRIFVKAHENYGAPVVPILEKTIVATLTTTRGNLIDLLYRLIAGKYGQVPVDMDSYFNQIAGAFNQGKMVCIFDTENDTKGIVPSRQIQTIFIESCAKETFNHSLNCQSAKAVWDGLLLHESGKVVIKRLLVLATLNILDCVADGCYCGFGVPNDRIATRVDKDVIAIPNTNRVMNAFDTVEDIWKLAQLVSEVIAIWLSSIKWIRSNSSQLSLK